MIGAVFLAAPLALLASLTAIIPLVLHLLGRKRAVRIEFAAMRFIQSAVARTARRRRIQNLGLLIVRMAICALLPVALGLPFYRPGQPSHGQARDLAIAILLDNSGSMGQISRQQSIFDRAKLWALRLIRGLDQIGPPRTVVLAATQGDLAVRPMVTNDLEAAADAVRQMQLTSGEAILTPALTTASSSLAKLPSADRIIYVLTDFQRSSFRLIDRSKLSDNSLVMLELGAEGGGNLGIEHVETLGPTIAGSDVTMRVKISGTPAGPVTVPVTLVLPDGQTLVRQDVHLDGRAIKTKQVDLPATALGPGWFQATVELGLDDALPIDNRWHLAFRVAQPAGALVVTERTDYSDWQDDPAIFIIAGLRAARWMAPQRIDFAELKTVDLADVSAVYMAGPVQLDGEVIERLDDYLKLGHRALIVFLPAGPSGELYQPMLERFELGRLAQLIESDRALRISEINTSDRLIAQLAFKPSHYHHVGITRLRSVVPAPSARRLLTLETGQPLILTAQRGSSAVYLFTSAADTTAGTFTVSPIFPALISAVPAQLAQHASAPTHRAGKPIKIDATSDVKVVDQTLTAPITTLPPGSSEILLHNSGTYSLVDPTGTIIQQLAVNCSEKVVDLTRVDDAKLQALTSWPTCYLADPEQDLQAKLTELAQGKPLWDYLIVVVLIAMLVETLIANLYRPPSQTP